jgi:hypothetical protein
MRLLLPLASILVAVACAPAVSAKVSPTTLEEVAWSSELIAVGRDVRVFDVHGWRVAEFAVDRVLKGDAQTRTLYYLADPTWTCDVSTAAPGEKSLIFLGRVAAEEAQSDFFSRPSRETPPVTIDARPIYWISHAGRGRMPIMTSSAGQQSVRLITADIDLPDSLAAKAFDVSEYGILSSLSLEAVERVVLKLPLEPPAPTPTAPTGPLPPEKLRPG